MKRIISRVMKFSLRQKSYAIKQLFFTGHIMKQHEAQPLISLKTGDTGIIAALKNDGEQRSRLIAQGLFVGACIEVIHVDAQQGLSLIGIEDARIVVEHEIGRHIFVVPLCRRHQHAEHVAFWRKKQWRRWRFGKITHDCQ